MSALAAEGGTPPRNVTITVVMPDSEPPQLTEPPPATSAAIILYPVDVAENIVGSRRQIVKTYELSPFDNPTDINRADFERNGWLYSLTDILKRETANAETRAHTETVTLNTDTKELNQILALLAPTIEYTSEDDFVGLLYLDVASIKVETAGTKTTSFEMKVTREYPHLSANDTELVPKTVTENGKTYHLAGVDWKVGNYSTVDYERIPDYYTAFATYTATGSSTKVTGYVTTAQYNGNLAKLSAGKTVYTAYFEGSEIRTPLEMVQPEPTQTLEPEPVQIEELVDEPEPTAEPTPTDEPEETPAAAPLSDGGKDTALLLIVALLALLAGLAAGGVFYLYKTKTGKGLTNYEKTSHTPADADDDDSDGDTRDGG